ncbi:MAG: cation transporter [bacterium]
MARVFLKLGLVVSVCTVLFSSCGRDDTATHAADAQKMAANVQKVTLEVHGMTCAGCEFNVESAVKKIDGVARVKADYANGSADIEYDPEKASVEQLVEAVNGVGFKASQSSLN